MKKLVASGFQARSIHGNKSQNQREKAIAAFKRGEVRILVATDVAARGIDIPGVTHVYNYDLPEVPDIYVHRIGRTARAGAAGEAVAFCSAEELHLLRAIEKLMGISVRVASGEQPQGHEAGEVRSRRNQRRNSGRSHSGAHSGEHKQQATAKKPKRHRGRHKPAAQQGSEKAPAPNRHRPAHANSNTKKSANRRNRRSGRRRAAA